MKRQLGQKAPSPPSPQTIFVDRSLGSKKIPDGVRATGVNVEIHDDHFSRDEDDTKWLAACGAHSWIFLTKDERIRRDPAEVRAVIAANVHAIFIGRQGITAEEMLSDLIPALPRILKRFREAKKPSYVLVHKGGRLDRLEVKTGEDGTPRLSVPDPNT